MGKGRPRAVEKGVVGASNTVTCCESTSVPSGPVYYPTEDEFKDPLDYIYKIRPEAEPYGICRIVPPKGWNPPFALDLDTFTFPTKTQAIHKLQARPAASDSMTFDLEYSRFLQDQCGKKSRKRVVFEGEDLDLCKLFNAVKRFGGYDKVVDAKKWGDVARFLRPAGKITDCAKHVLCQLYREHLYDYEEFYNKMNQGTAVNCKKGERDERKSDHRVQSSTSKKHPRRVSGLKVKDCKVHVEEERDQICEQCKSGLHGEVMLLCDRCDKGWHTYCLSPPLKQIPQGNWYCFSCLNSDRDSFGFVPGKHYTLEAFRRIADRSRRRWFGSGPVSRVQMEKKFWEIVEGSVGEVEVMYGNDLDTSVYGSGFPRVADQKMQSVDDKLWQEYATIPWNLNNLPKLKGSMLRSIQHNITGVMVPWLYIGMLFSSFCWHFEDHCFYSMNYLHWGEPKCWYSVPGNQASAFEKVMRSSLPDLFDAQPDLLFQLVTMLNPSVLQENGVPVYSVLQEPGNFVITFPRSYHGGFNLGLNCAEAVNFAPADWLPFGAFGADLYQRYHKPAVLSHEELLCVVAQHGDVDSRVSSYLKKELLRISDKEKSWREKLWKDGIIKYSRMTPRKCPQYVGTEEDPTCIICQQYLYLSAVVCSCRPSSFVCLEHSEHLCECKTVKLRLLYRHSLAELFDLAFSMEEFTSDDKAECRSVRRQSSCQGALTKKVKGISVNLNQLATEWLLQSSTILQNPFLSNAFVTTLRKAEQFLWAGSEMDSVRDMVKTLIEAQKWAEGIRDCITKIEFWYQDSTVKKVHLEFIDELLRFNPPPCNEPNYHKLKEYAEEARLLVQDIDTALSRCSKMSELELLYSRACGLPIYMKESKKLEGRISLIKTWLDSVRKCISARHPTVLEFNILYKLKSEILDLQVHLPEIEVFENMLNRAESCSIQCREMLEGPMNLQNVSLLLKEWDNFAVAVPELQLLRQYHSDTVLWVAHVNDLLRRAHVQGDQHNTVNELMHIFEEGSSLKIQVDELPLVEMELKKASCRENALKAHDSRMPLEFIQQLLEEAKMLHIEEEKLFVDLSCVLALAIPWEERAREILSHENPISDFEDMIRDSENIFAILPSLNDVKDAFSEANLWLRNSKPYLVSSPCASSSLLKVEDLQMLVSESKLLKVSLGERRMLELVLKNCKLWECEASSLLDDCRCLFELDNCVDGVSSDLMFRVEDLIARIQSAIASGVSLGFDFIEISKLQASCSTLQWCKRALCFSDCPSSLEDVLEVAEGLSHSSVSGALLKVLVDGVEWLRRALEEISRPCNSRRCHLTEVQDTLNDYKNVNMTFGAVYGQLEEAIRKHMLWQEQVHQFFGLNSRDRSWSLMLQLKELGDTVAFSCSELDMILSEVEKVENWKKRCLDKIGSSVQTDNLLFNVLKKIKQTLERSLFIYGDVKERKDQNLCICCLLHSECQEFLTCSTCMDCYHLQCIGLTAKDTCIENYKCPYCAILIGESHYPSGGGLLRFGKKRIELKILTALLSEAEHFCLSLCRIDEMEVLNELVEKALLCKSFLREILNFASTVVDEDISIVSEKLMKAIKASDVAGVYDEHDNSDLELALAKNLWKIQVNRLLNGVCKPTIRQIQKHMNEGVDMEISAEDHYMLKLTSVKCLGLQWAELAKKVANDSGALSLDKVLEVIVEGENLPVDVDEELKMLRFRCMLYCICRKPYDKKGMIACKQCNEWYHFDCMKLPCTQQLYICPACNPCAEEPLPTNHERLGSAKFVEPKTPSPRHTNPRKKQKRDVGNVTCKMFTTATAAEDRDSSRCRKSNGIECLRWQNRKPFRRAAKKRVELRSLTPILYTQR
ncbi:lysine-specific demethylase 5B isoform X1 [Arachis ipaensis]|uniref:lysine-specific demethylase 5B isoform X1 n=1 Tax=Arachis ipaensis TaxID=130454 RepID=UPI000A2B4976|nr:lysine-specific demethylase 5B isoform X1 [Arachis ipaensis]XP_020978799.1 lysine-specific demethylase 5B isoform X1 [Arachis ipaensis]